MIRLFVAAMFVVVAMAGCTGPPEWDRAADCGYVIRDEDEARKYAERQGDEETAAYFAARAAVFQGMKEAGGSCQETKIAINKWPGEPAPEAPVPDGRCSDFAQREDAAASYWRKRGDADLAQHFEWRRNVWATFASGGPCKALHEALEAWPGGKA